MLLYECNKKEHRTERSQIMSEDEKNQLCIEHSIIEKRKTIQKAYALYKMGYGWKNPERLLNEGFSSKCEVDGVIQVMFEMFENALISLTTDLTEAIIGAYDGTNGDYNTDEIRKARTIAGVISRIMLNDGNDLKNDLSMVNKDELLNVAKFTLYDICSDYDIETTLCQMKYITD